MRWLLVVALVASSTAAGVTVFGRSAGSIAPQGTFTVVFPEGFTRGQMAVRVGTVAALATRASGEHFALTAQAYVAASSRARVPCFGDTVRRDLEGFLFPATYDFVATTTAKELVAAQVQAFCRAWGSVGLSYARSKDLTPYNVLEIASMIEREARLPGERPLVAAVVYNRLHAGMPLALDATLRYGLRIPATQPILASQLRDPTPYNTRVHTGLPPTPIANPGLAAMRAAARPAQVDYLYFVLRPGSDSQFFTASASAFYAYECAHGYAC
ncbi:MAG TPA: endolytic transglycosylase MltG [Gaiellaceae bacterium]|nr:endolytic transglycosylase MltG [Gaiellaceae bacterium]